MKLKIKENHAGVMTLNDGIKITNYVRNKQTNHKN